MGAAKLATTVTAEGASMFAMRLRRALAVRDIRPAQLARKLNISSSAVNQWLRGKTIPSPQRMIQIAVVVGIEASEMMGAGEYPAHGQPQPNEAQTVRIPELPMLLDMRPDDHDGYICSLDRRKAKGYEWEIPKSCFSAHASEHPDLCITQVTGNSMAPEFRAGDYVLVDLNWKEFTASGVYLIAPLMWVDIRQCDVLAGQDAGNVRLRSAMDEHGTICSIDKVNVVGRVLFSMLVPR